MSLPIPEFINRDPQTIINEMVADYESRVGKTLEPAQVEMFLINAFAYREQLVRNQIQDAAMQNLVAYARFPMLDYLGELVGVVRLPSQAARTTLLLTLVEGHGDIVIPSGLRVSSTDGRAIFELIQDYTVLTGTNTVIATAIAQSDGKTYNNYEIGTITVIMDPQPYLATVSNTTVSEGGTDNETDDAMRERIKLAPSSFSVAGPSGAYEYWTRTASPLIIDVQIENPIPGTVEVFPLIEGGTVTPPEILDAVSAVLSAEKIRPLNDTVLVTSPTPINTAITVGLILYEGAVQSDILPIVQSNLENFKNGKRKLLGQDIVIDQIKSLCMIDGVYKANVSSPATDLILASTEFANITAITVTVTGTNEG